MSTERAVDNPLVSVAVTAFNIAPFASEMLAGIAAQNYRPIEVVIYDDASTDATGALLEAFAAEQAIPVKVIRGARNIGHNEALRIALANCTGEYVAILDGDDEWLSGKLEAQVAWFKEDASRVLCGHDVECFDSDTGRVLWTVSGEGRLVSGCGPARAIRNGPIYPTSAITLRRSSIPTDFNPHKLAGYTDWNLWSDCLAGGGEYGFVPGVYSRYRCRSTGLVGEIDRSPDLGVEFLRAGLVWLAEFVAWQPEHHHACKYRRGVLLANHGKVLFERGDIPESRDYFRAARWDLGRDAWKAAGLQMLAALPPAARSRVYSIANSGRLMARARLRRARR